MNSMNFTAAVLGTLTGIFFAVMAVTGATPAQIGHQMVAQVTGSATCSAEVVAFDASANPILAALPAECSVQ